MRIAVSATGPDLRSRVDPTFGRCAYFVVVDLGRDGVETVSNTGMSLDSGAGARSVQVLIDAKVTTVLTGRCGLQAMRALDAAGIDVHTGYTGIVADAIDRYSSECASENLPRA